MEASFEEDIICIRTKSAPPSDDSVVPVHGDPLPLLSMIGKLLHKSLQGCGHQPQLQWQKRKINRGEAKEYLRSWI